MDSFGRSDVGHAASALTRITIAAAVALPATTVLAETLTAREIMHRVEDRDAGDDGRRASGQGHAPHPQVPPRYQDRGATEGGKYVEIGEAGHEPCGFESRPPRHKSLISFATFRCSSTQVPARCR